MEYNNNSDNPKQPQSVVEVKPATVANFIVEPTTVSKSLAEVAATIAKLRQLDRLCWRLWKNSLGKQKEAGRRLEDKNERGYNPVEITRREEQIKHFG